MTKVWLLVRIGQLSGHLQFIVKPHRIDCHGRNELHKSVGSGINYERETLQNINFKPEKPWLGLAFLPEESSLKPGSSWSRGAGGGGGGFA